MENTGQFQIANNEPRWFLAMETESIGPLRASELLDRMKGSEGQAPSVHGQSYLWRDGLSDWMRLSDIKEFQDILSQLAKPPRLPPKPPKLKIIPPPVPKTGPVFNSDKIWFLHYKDAQYGPFSEADLANYIKIGKIHKRVHLWKEGLTDWSVLETIPELQAVLESVSVLRPTSPSSKSGPRQAGGSHAGMESNAAKDRRQFPRKPCVARLLMTDQRTLFMGICRDVSVGGMQVLTKEVPGGVGDLIKMNISSAGHGDESLEPFTAQGEIVRILEDQQGFSFRFIQLKPEFTERLRLFLSGSSKDPV